MLGNSNPYAILFAMPIPRLHKDQYLFVTRSKCIFE